MKGDFKMNTIFNKTENKIIPARLREGRIARAMSLADLSEKVGVSSQAISQYELGTSTPSSTVFMNIVNILDFPSTFFYKANSVVSNAGNSATYFRGNKNNTKKLKEAFNVRINWIEEITSILLKYLELPKLDIPDIDDLLHDDEIGDNTIEEIAIRLREYWALNDSPVPNIVDILQTKGFIITRLELKNKKVDAFSKWYNGKPYIVLGSDKNSAVRSRFDLAHELGHLIMHRNINQDDISNRKILDRIENEANKFAAAFLLPLKAFNKEVISSSINHFVILKQRWKASISAMIRRCQDSKILTDNQIRYLNSQMIRYGYFRREPLDDTLRIEKPYLFKQAFSVLIDNNVMNKQKLLDIISLNSKEAESLFCLEDGYLSSNTNTIKLNLVNGAR